MPLQFDGSFDELRRWLADLSMVGRWSSQPNGCYMLRLLNVQVHWSSTKFTLWATGKNRRAVESRLAYALCVRSSPFDFDEEDDEDEDAIDFD